MTEVAAGSGQILPGGIVTFLFTDIEDSTRLWEKDRVGMIDVIARHNAIAEASIPQYGGVLVKKRGEGDSLFAVFPRATGAVEAAAALQVAFHTEPWPESLPLRVRMALHTGEADLRDNDYFGPAVNRCARLRAIAHGGQTLLSQATREQVCEALPDQCSLNDLGMHRLKDLQRPEQVFQLCHPDLAHAFPALRSLNALQHNLPLQLTSFIGREAEIAEVKRLLRGQPSTSNPMQVPLRLLTMMGPGGAGKTRLALQAASELVDAYPDGVWLVELASLKDPLLIPQLICSALGVREGVGHEFSAALRDHLIPKDLLLVLDNCEHLQEACAEIAETLLQACPRVQILATSRGALRIAGETTWRIPSLPLPDPKNLPPIERLAEIDAIHLFVERARAVSRFALTTENAEAVVQICHRLDGMPFALELAAAKVRMMTVDQIAARLFDVLVNPVKRLARHETMEALIDWSYKLLSEAEKTLLLRLSVFSGGWTLEAAEAVCGDDEGALDVFQTLSELDDNSLLVVEEQESAIRYRLLETVRQYAAKKLKQSGEEKAVQDWHVSYFLGLAEEAEGYLTGPKQALYLKRLEADHDNLRMALKLAVDGDTRLRLAGAMGRFWSMQGYLAEGRSWLIGALARGQGRRSLQAKALNAMGVLAMRQGDDSEADQHLQASLQYYREINDLRGVAEALGNLGTVAMYQDDPVAAFAFAEESLKLRQDLNELWGAAAMLANIGLVARNRGDYAQAKLYYEQSLRLFREMGDKMRVATLFNNLGGMAHTAGDDDEAHRYFEEALAIFRELENRLFAAIILYNLGEVALKKNLCDAAKRRYVESLEMRMEVGDRGGIPFVLCGLGKVAKAERDFERAVRLYASADALRIALGRPLPQADTAEHNQHIADLRAALSENAFTAAWTRGATTAFDATIAYAAEQVTLH